MLVCSWIFLGGCPLCVFDTCPRSSPQLQQPNSRDVREFAWLEKWKRQQCCQPLNSIVRSMANAQHPGPYPSVTPLQLLLKLQQVELHFLCFIHLQASIPKLTVGKFGVNNVNETWLNFRAFRTVSTGACNVVASRLLLSGAQVLDGAIISGWLTCHDLL